MLSAFIVSRTVSCEHCDDRQIVSNIHALLYLDCNWPTFVQTFVNLHQHTSSTMAQIGDYQCLAATVYAQYFLSTGPTLHKHPTRSKVHSRTVICVCVITCAAAPRSIGVASRVTRWKGINLGALPFELAERSSRGQLSEMSSSSIIAGNSCVQ